MIKRTIEISREPNGVHLSVRDGQLLVLRKVDPPKPLPTHPANLAGTIPCEDIGVVMVDQRETSYSHSALAELAEHGAALVVCGRSHHPVGMYLPLSTNSQLLARLDAQLNARKPTLKRVWASLVESKVRAQSDALPEGTDTAAAKTRLNVLARSVRSGDPENIEAQAAAAYWPVLFARAASVTQPFRRRAGERDAPPPNNLLDYGYAALRAAVARALVSAGLLPAIGIKHHGRSNPFCLADDLMEPLRPLLDRRVRWLAQRDELTLEQPTKAELLAVLTDEVECGNGPNNRGPLLVAVVRYVASFVRVILQEQRELDVPRWPNTRDSESDRGRSARDDDPEL